MKRLPHRLLVWWSTASTHGGGMPPKENESSVADSVLPGKNPTLEEKKDEVQSLSRKNNDNVQSLFIIRHGDRWDYENPEWAQTTTRPGDPPLSTLGHQQARETGLFLDAMLAEEGISAENVTWLSSPFLRCLQTSNEALNVMTKVQQNTRIPILPEYSVFEWDHDLRGWHDSLPPLAERAHYFPRLDASHESAFVPELPETKEDFIGRCGRASSALGRRYPFSPRSVLVIVTHAAGCIALAAAAANVPFQQITPAAPSGIYRLTRGSAEQVRWDLDPHDDVVSGMNGCTRHFSSLASYGSSTAPWNRFGDKEKDPYEGYTGPPNSRFAPAELRQQYERQRQDEL